MNILIAPNQSEKLLLVTLPRPTDNSPQQFLYDENNIVLYEVTKYHDHFRSWFIDNLFCKDGHLHILTRIDPLFIFVPLLIKLTDRQYRTLHDICMTFSSDNNDRFSKIDYALSPDIKWDHICDTKEIEDELYIKFSNEKTIKWLLNKHKNTFIALGKQLGQDTSKATLISYATDLICQYLPTGKVNEFKSAVDKAKYDLANYNGSKNDTLSAPKVEKSFKRPAEQIKDTAKSGKTNSMNSSPKEKVVPKNSMYHFLKR